MTESGTRLRDEEELETADLATATAERAEPVRDTNGPEASGPPIRERR